MKSLNVLAPAEQHWSCHSCSGCCRQHEIEITAAEKARIEAQNWPQTGEIPPGQPLFEPLGRSGRWRLAHQADGGCVFLRPDGLCRIHARFGEAAKPLACRLYPYAFHPAGGRDVRVSLRFSCPSVIANRGRPVTDAAAELRRLAGAALPSELQRISPPALADGIPLRWSECQRVVDELAAWVEIPELGWPERLMAGGLWLQLLAAAWRESPGERADEAAATARVLAKGIVEQLAANAAPQPDRVAWTVFRQHVGFYARTDAPTLRGKVVHRWKLLKASLAWASGFGRLVPLVEGLRPTAWKQILHDTGGWPEGSDALWRRYFRVKLHGLHFAGAGFFGWSVLDGFAALAAVLPVTLCIARWRALSEDRKRITLPDVHFALAIADHNHGYSAGVGNRAARRRIRLLGRDGGKPLYALCRRLIGDER